MTSFLFLTKARSRATYAPILSIAAVTDLIFLSESAARSVSMGFPCLLLSAVLSATMPWKYLAIAWDAQIIHDISFSSKELLICVWNFSQPWVCPEKEMPFVSTTALFLEFPILRRSAELEEQAQNHRSGKPSKMTDVERGCAVLKRGRGLSTSFSFFIENSGTNLNRDL